MTKNMFKKGDKVKCIDPTCLLTLGKVYEIIRTNEVCVWVKNDKDERDFYNQGSSYVQERFELAEPELDYWQKNNLTKPQSRIVCSANKHKTTGRLILGPRHWDNTMRAQKLESENWSDFEQGFVDQWGSWFDREESYEIAEAANQLLFHDKAWGRVLYSESVW